MNLHLLYTTKSGRGKSKKMEFKSFPQAEKYLKKIGAIWWEIGIDDADIERHPQGLHGIINGTQGGS